MKRIICIKDKYDALIPIDKIEYISLDGWVHTGGQRRDIGGNTYNYLLSIFEEVKENDSMEENPKECMYARDNYTDEDRKVLCDGCEEECRFNKKEEPVSEDLEKTVDTYLATYFGSEQEKQEWPFLKKMAIYFANWQKQQMEAYRIKHCKSLTNEQAELEDKFVSSHVEKNNRMPTFLDAIEYGIEYGKQQMIQQAVTAEVRMVEDFMGTTTFRCVYDKYKIGDKVKLIIIKED